MVTFRETFRELGYVEGKTIAYEYRLSSEQEIDRSAQELVHSGVDLVIAPGTPPALALKRATAEVPIVFIAVDPVASGLVASFGHPGANATGVATLSDETGAKRVELLKELLPRAKRVGVLLNQSNSMNAVQLTSIESAAARLKLKTRLLSIRSKDDLEHVLGLVTSHQVDAMIILSDAILFAHSFLIAERALKRGLPSISAYRFFPEAGGLMSYGPDWGSLWRQCAIYVDKILKGARPADLPVQQPSRFELVVNAKTAQALKIKVPDSILSRADEVIK
jgi:ABC-type uncharacterized transport system substrate-binding protein